MGVEIIAHPQDALRAVADGRQGIEIGPAGDQAAEKVDQPGVLLHLGGPAFVLAEAGVEPDLGLKKLGIPDHGMREPGGTGERASGHILRDLLHQLGGRIEGAVFESAAIGFAIVDLVRADDGHRARRRVMLLAAMEEGLAARQHRRDGIGVVAVAGIGVTAEGRAQAVEAAKARHPPEMRHVARSDLIRIERDLGGDHRHGCTMPHRGSCVLDRNLTPARRGRTSRPRP